MGKNAYFQIIHKPNQTLLKVFPASKDGEMFQVDEVMKYFELINISSYDTVKLNDYLNRGDYRMEFPIINTETPPENERCVVTINEMGMSATVRFYPPSDNGKRMTRDDIISDLRLASVTHGIREDVVEQFMKSPEYCKSYMIAVATEPIQGHDAHIEYHFDTDTAARPKLNEDGSVDFHQLGNIKPVAPGDKLATLTKADIGKPGINVTGVPIPQKKVTLKVLRYGKNISISEDKCTIYSQTAGHVMLVDDLVMVSDVYDVPANVDASTGDIEYKGTVNVTGNVNTGYFVKADGDIIVNGVVEGATLIAGGDIILKRGMQGMSRGTLEAEGNIAAKFIESATVKCGGTLMCDAVLHSNVETGDDISVLGRKGLINGGHIKTYGNIAATTLGSIMGTATVVEIMSDVEKTKLLNDTEEKINEVKDAIKKMDNALQMIKRSAQGDKQLTPQQIQYVRLVASSKPKLEKEILQMGLECKELREVIAKNAKVSIKVNGTVNAGVKIVIKDMSRIINDNVSACKFVREGADIKSVGLY
ncbi:MAG: FapA family protein [Roseburia sp.]|nr:FapA family protein [Roseburia sp.]